MTNIIARAHRATGDAASAILLLRIAFRYQQALNAGREWTAQSYEDLMTETSCTFKQVRKGIANLKKLGLVLWKRAMFANKPVGHFQLTEKGILVIKGGDQHTLEGVSTRAPQVPSTQALEGPNAQAPQGANYIQGETTLSNNMEDNSSHVLAPEVEVTTVKEIEEKFKSKKIFEKHHKPDKVIGLVIVWKDAYFEKYGGFLPNFTQKQTCQMKLLLSRCPPGKAAGVVRWIIDNWLEFTEKVMSHTGTKSAPVRPQIDYAAKNVVTGINLMAPKVKAKIVSPPVQSIAIQAAPVQKEKPATLEEIQAIDAEDDD